MRVLRLLAASMILLVPARAANAQWYAGVFLGANHTQPADVSINQPGQGRSVIFSSVRFEARPFQSPQYYGWRAGRLFGASHSTGVELEFIHLKMIGLTDQSYAFTGTGGPSNLSAPMNAVVQRYSMTHGLNFALVNFVSRTPIGGPVTLSLRSGVGVTIPHSESTIDGEIREQYEYAGVGTALSAGVDFPIGRHLSGMADYKLTYARPRITIAGGTGQTTAVSHQILFGVAFGVPR